MKSNKKTNRHVSWRAKRAAAKPFRFPTYRGRAPDNAEAQEIAQMVAKAVRAWRAADPAMTREELAVVCQKSVSTVARWETGLIEPVASDIRRMETHKPGIVGLIFGE